jgi:hypothetical protein
MKKISKFLMFILGIFLTAGFTFSNFNLNGQVYKKSPNRTKFDSWNKEQLNLALDQSIKAAKLGKTLTIVGIGSGIIGGIAGWEAVTHLNNWSGIQKGIERKGMGVYAMEAGILTAAMGVSIWIDGKSRKKRIEFALTKSNPGSYVETAGLKINF